jgi:hypothetical protein
MYASQRYVSPLKPTSVGDPDIYLSAKLKETQLPNSIWAWGLSPSMYVNQAMQNCQTHLTQKLDGWYKIPAKAENPFACDYCPDTDVTEHLDPECASFFQHLIGVMHWMVELGRVDIATEVSMLSLYLALPREGHLEASLHLRLGCDFFERVHIRHKKIKKSFICVPL